MSSQILSFKVGLFVLLLMVSGLVPISSAAPLDRWQWRSPSPQGNSLNDVKFINGTFVAVGNVGTILTSADGTNWTVRTSATTKDLLGVAYGNGTYCVCGADGLMLTSTDMQTWVSWPTSSTNRFRGVAFGAGVFVAAEGAFGFSANSRMFLSTNGADWSTGNSGNYPSFRNVTYGASAGRFVAVGGTDNGHIVTSTNGLDWTYSAYGGLELDGIVFANDKFVAVGANYLGFHGQVATSPNGIEWTSRESGTTQALKSVCYGQGFFLAAGNNGTMIYSQNGTTWEDASPDINVNFSGIAYGNGLFVAVGTGGAILTSVDADTWVSRTSGNAVEYNAVLFANNQFVATGSEGAIATSTNGSSWTDRSSGTSAELRSVAYGNGVYVAGGSGAILTSSNGINWTQQSSLSAVAMVWSGDKFVGVNYLGGNRGIVFSTNGLLWTLISLPTGPLDIAYGNGVYLAVFGLSPIYRSTDGTNWSAIPNSPSAYISRVTHEGGKFVASGSSGGFWTSLDGLSWTNTPLFGTGTADSCNFIAYGNGVYIRGGEPYPYGVNTFFVSTDGLNWQRNPINVKISLKDMAYGLGTFVAVGASGSILQSEDVRVPWLSGNLALTNGFEISVNGELGRAYRLQTSDDLRVWSDVCTYTNAEYLARLTDAAATNRANGYYRVVSP